MDFSPTQQQQSEKKNRSNDINKNHLGLSPIALKMLIK
jgi:hypothetical protein